MSNQIQIDLSKAYAGQIVTFRNGETDTLNDSCAQSDAMEKFDVYFNYYNFPSSKEYFKNGRRMIDCEYDFDIIALSDPIQVQAARLEGEIKGLEFTLPLLSVYFIAKRDVLAKIEQLKEQLRTLTNEGNN